MDFFKSHYEKIILAALLLIFAGAFLLLVFLIQAAQNKKVDEIVNKKDPAPDFLSADYKTGARYSGNAVFSAAYEWNDRTQNPGIAGKTKADLMTPQPLALCPHCFRLVPAECFPPKGGKKPGTCPLCGNTLKPRTSDIDVVSAIPGNDDADGNGIPDEWEEKFGLFGQEDPDPDGDGISNLDEFAAQTNPNDIKSHPLYVTKLFLTEQPKFETLEEMLPQKVKKDFRRGTIRMIQIWQDANAPKGWTAEFLFKQKRQYRPRYSIGEKVCYRRQTSMDGANVPSIGYSVADIIPAGEKGTGDTVLLKNDTDGTILQCRVNEPIRSPEATLTFSYPLLAGATIKGKAGGTLELGNEKTGVEKYRIAKTVSSAGTGSVNVTLTAADGKTTYVIRMAPEPGPEETTAEPGINESARPDPAVQPPRRTRTRRRPASRKRENRSVPQNGLPGIQWGTRR